MQRKVGWALIILGAIVLLFLGFGWYLAFLSVTINRREFPLGLATTEIAVILLLFVVPGVLLVRWKR